MPLARGSGGMGAVEFPGSAQSSREMTKRPEDFVRSAMTTHLHGENTCEQVAGALFRHLDPLRTGFLTEAQLLPIWPVLARHLEGNGVEALKADLLNRDSKPIRGDEWMRIMAALREVVGQRRFRHAVGRVEEMLLQRPTLRMTAPPPPPSFEPQKSQSNSWLVLPNAVDTTPRAKKVTGCDVRSTSPPARRGYPGIRARQPVQLLPAPTRGSACSSQEPVQLPPAPAQASARSFQEPGQLPPAPTQAPVPSPEEPAQVPLAPAQTPARSSQEPAQLPPAPTQAPVSSPEEPAQLPPAPAQATVSSPEEPAQVPPAPAQTPARSSQEPARFPPAPTHAPASSSLGSSPPLAALVAIEPESPLVEGSSLRPAVPAAIEPVQSQLEGSSAPSAYPLNLTSERETLQQSHTSEMPLSSRTSHRTSGSKKLGYYAGRIVAVEPAEDASETSHSDDDRVGEGLGEPESVPPLWKRASGDAEALPASPSQQPLKPSGPSREELLVESTFSITVLHPGASPKNTGPGASKDDGEEPAEATVDRREDFEDRRQVDKDEAARPRPSDKATEESEEMFTEDSSSQMDTVRSEVRKLLGDTAATGELNSVLEVVLGSKTAEVDESWSVQAGTKAQEVESRAAEEDEVGLHKSELKDDGLKSPQDEGPAAKKTQSLRDGEPEPEGEEREPEDSFELYFDVPFDEIDQKAFKDELHAGFRRLGAPDYHVSRVDSELRASRSISRTFGPTSSVKVIKALPLHSLEVMGFPAHQEPIGHLRLQEEPRRLRALTFSEVEIESKGSEVELGLDKALVDPQGSEVELDWGKAYVELKDEPRFSKRTSLSFSEAEMESKASDVALDWVHSNTDRIIQACFASEEADDEERARANCKAALCAAAEKAQRQQDRAKADCHAALTAALRGTVVAPVQQDALGSSAPAQAEADWDADNASPSSPEVERAGEDEGLADFGELDADEARPDRKKAVPDAAGEESPASGDEDSGNKVAHTKAAGSQEPAPKGKPKAKSRAARRKAKEEAPPREELQASGGAADRVAGRRPPREDPQASHGDRGDGKLPRIAEGRLGPASADRGGRRAIVAGGGATKLPNIEDGGRSGPDRTYLKRSSSPAVTVYRPEPPIDEEDEGLDLHLDLRSKCPDDAPAIKKEMRDGLSKIGATKNTLNRVRINLRMDVGVAEIRGPGRAMSYLKVLPLEHLTIAGQPVRPVHDPPLARDFRAKLESEAAEHRRTLARMKDLERRLRKMDITLAARDCAGEDIEGMLRSQSMPSMGTSRKRFGITDSKAVYNNTPSHVPQVRSPPRARRSIVLPALHCLREAPSVRANEVKRETEKLKDEAALNTKEVALAHSQASVGNSNQSRAERSRVRQEAIRQLESRGLNSWELRSQEKVSRLQEFAVFGESMWDTFYDWRDAVESVT